ncbi:Predicted anti-sigma-YlaC factor YlaD, contains Zn-finger domain [Klenkia taihuensis]|uniref:Predicted anti-sigma-YlaC factor YlaD, contains Zn-finger domain n=2 Tax=Klenkia taihuensis TaxID=1225127 RepID=A0A1I1UMT9_9ACTN|nr:Predicted anti-sigma-YlaC factor YlaD, contains Zn-finger domain [Klenkia taihuensis]
MPTPGNRGHPGADHHTMHCERFREAASARMDGEGSPVPEAALDAHLDGCAACAAWAATAAAVTRRARLAPAPAVPDLTATVLAALPDRLPGAAAAARSRLVTTALRLALLAVGVAQIGLATPSLLDGAGAMSAPVHMAHETGAWNLGLAVAFLACAAAPRLAPGALPFLVTFTLVLTVTTVADLESGHVHADRAVGHLLLLVGLLLTATLAWRGRRRRSARAAAGVRVLA